MPTRGGGTPARGAGMAFCLNLTTVSTALLSRNRYSMKDKM